MRSLLKLIPVIAIVIFASAFTNNLEHGKGYDVGDVVEDFKLKNIDGSFISLADYKEAKGFIITFTCNTCPFAIAYEDRIIALDKKYASKGYPVIAINPNNPNTKPGDNFEAMQQRAKEKGFTFPYLVDEGQKVYPKFGATKTPHNYLVQKTKKGMVVKYIGAIDDSSRNPDAVSETYLEDAVDALLNGEEIKLQKTKAIGCSIKV
ncbi:thioredoxin family protein [Hyunsoonleella pacifica]|uniref:Thioredoxin family protein n=1 Tax=Hyunsoonleella pacifica TaxID=1080224 RepID=A0A4Q9FJR6_9FLAO|nr:thioredoxin family protein [Hyunsoonleella pacifica]TBN13897.1 thioredoxin family protein [Hyunsoonleella pacifica]GGD26641.1 thioredoxin family protein [Hyunsoonleella pacifica]